MQISCPRCGRTLDYTDTRPAFCSHCGSSLRGSTSLAEPDVTAEYRSDPTIAQGVNAADADWWVPERVAGYKLLRKLGVGGMGSVHEAEEDATGRRVAVKLIAPELVASGVAVDRFLQEGRLASAIAHPRCVFVLAADQSDGLPYIVMELMPGTTLKDLVGERGPLPVEEAVAKIFDVIEGLQEAHRIGVLHRDVKPSNCFLEADGRVKIGDFGLSKSLASDANLTRTGAFLGTPQYASPEQIRGEPLDARTDVYSVAATLYFLLVGQAPFEGGDAAATLAKIVADPVPPPRNLRSEIPRALEKVVLRGLERNRDRRYRDLNALRAALIPFVPDRLSMGSSGLRIGAYLLELAAIRLLLLPIGLFERRLTFFDVGNIVLILDTFFFLIFYVLIEGLTGASPGKWLMRLRVYRSDAAQIPGLARALLRASLFYGLSVLPATLLWFGGEWTGLASLSYVSILCRLAGYLVLASTMRARNGYRGIHELLSGTRVVRLPGRELHPQVPVGKNLTPTRELVRHEGLPDSVGPFRVDGALSGFEGPNVLLGSDPGLGRSVWVVFRPLDAPAMSKVRCDLSRLTRPRWISGGERDGRRWDAFVAPTGRSIDELRSQGGPLGWGHARVILESLAEELEDASRDGTLPTRLSPDQVLVQHGGRVELLDFIDLEGDPELADPDPQLRGLALLASVSRLALAARRSRAARPRLSATLPLHVREMIARLENGPDRFRSVAEFRAYLDATREWPTELTYKHRIGRLGSFALLVAIQAVVIFVPISVAIAYLTYQAGTNQGDLAILRILSEPFYQFMQVLPFVIPLIWTFWGFVTQGGLSRRILGLALVRPDGSTPARWRCGLREGILWGIASALVLGPFWLESHFDLTYDDSWLFALSLALLILYASYGLFSRRRLLHDVIADTVVVPR